MARWPAERGKERSFEPASAPEPAELTQPTQVAGAEVGRPARVNGHDPGDHASLVGERSGCDHELSLVIEGDQAKVVGRVEALDQRDQRPLGPFEWRPTHGAAAVEHDLQ